MSLLSEKKNTKERLLEATIELALEHGLGAVSLGDVAMKVGIRKPSIYNHYASKSELLEGVCEHMRLLQPALEAWLPESLLQAIPNQACQLTLVSFADHYEALTSQEVLAKRNKLLHSERYFNPSMNALVDSDLKRMTQAVQVLLETMQQHGQASFKDLRLAAESFVYAMMCLSTHEERRGYADRYAQAHLQQVLDSSSITPATSKQDEVSTRKGSGILWKGKPPLL